MPAITERATNRLAETRKLRGLPNSYVPRLSRRAGKVVLDFRTQPAPDDRVANSGGMRLFVSPAVAPNLEDTVVDVQEKDGSQRLVLLRARSARK